ncbi:hypothetical protein B0G69_7885 [Paraburkholderia sp. RAU2J]|nr:hypothetical protein B0G69_7885 [Paraburkholderia sp. RAU2J]
MLAASSRSISTAWVNPPNTRPLPLGGDAAKQAYSRRWARPAMPMTTRCASRSSAHSKPNCSVANTSRPTNRHGGVCSRFWNWVAPCPCGHALRGRALNQLAPATLKLPFRDLRCASATAARHGSQHPFRSGQILNPCPGGYSPAFAFSAFSYPLPQQLASRLTCHGPDFRPMAENRAYHVPVPADPDAF